MGQSFMNVTGFLNIEKWYEIFLVCKPHFSAHVIIGWVFEQWVGNVELKEVGIGEGSWELFDLEELDALFQDDDWPIEDRGYSQKKKLNDE